VKPSSSSVFLAAAVSAPEHPMPPQPSLAQLPQTLHGFYPCGLRTEKEYKVCFLSSGCNYLHCNLTSVMTFSASPHIEPALKGLALDPYPFSTSP
jgi:hypothetical protein